MSTAEASPEVAFYQKQVDFLNIARES